MGPEVAAATTAAGTAGTAGTAAWLTPEVAGALLAGGTAAQMLASREQARAQRRILNRAQDENDRTVKEGADDTLKLAGGMAPATQAEKMQAAAQAAAGRTMDDLRGAGADMIDTAGGAGATSSNFGRLRAERQAAEADRLAAIAQEVGRVRAPAEVMGNEAMARSALAERLASAFRTNQHRAQAASLDAQGVDRPWYGDVGQLAALVGGIGLAGAPAAAGGGAAAAPATMGEMMAGSASATTPAFASAAPVAAGGANSALGRAIMQWGQGFGQRRQQPMWAGR